MKILLAEDDEATGHGVRAWLRLKGYAIDWFRDGDEALRALKVTAYEMVILDIGLPRMSGLSLLQWIRDRGEITPAIIITARDTLRDRVRGLDTGADDYIVKPFEMEELAARIRSLERRFHQRASLALSHHGVVLDPAAMTVMLDGNSVKVSSREFVLLRELLENKGKPVSRERLEHLLYSWGDEVESNAISVHIHNLRKKLGESFIVTRRGFGYVVD